MAASIASVGTVIPSGLGTSVTRAPLLAASSEYRYRTDGKFIDEYTTPLRGPWKSNAEITTASAIVTFWCIDTVSFGAPNSVPSWSPTPRARSHHVSAHARTPRVFHVRAYSSRSSSVSAGMAPSELEMR